MKIQDVFLYIALPSLVQSCTSVSELKPPAATAPSQCQLSEKRFQWSQKNPPKLIWLSIDSLNLTGLKEITSSLKNPHPKGFNWLLKGQNSNQNLTIREPTITASSHISTISCSTAEKHGIFANSQWNGSKMVSGFSTPIELETFATTLQKSGLRVATAGYPALDNSEDGRTVAEGFTYGESLGRSQIYPTDASPFLSHTWKDDHGNIIATLKMSSPANMNTKNFSCEVKRCHFSQNNQEDVIDITIQHNARPARAYVQFIKSAIPKIYVSPLFINKTFPEYARNKQEACDLIFSPGKDYSVSSFGAVHWLRGIQHRFEFFEKNWAHFLPSTEADVIFMYLEDIDAIRHQYAGDDSALEYIRQHYERLDKFLGEFFSSLPESTNVVVLGDHGMSTIRREINIRLAVTQEISDSYNIITSGGTALFYEKRKQSPDISATPSEMDLNILKPAREKMMRLKDPVSGQLVFKKVFLKGTSEMQAAGLSHKNAPFMIAFANEDFALQNSVENAIVLGDLDDKKKSAPRPRGQHGHPQESTKMKTFAMGWGPVLDKLNLSQINSNIELVPAIGAAFDWKVPPQCRRQLQ